MNLYIGQGPEFLSDHLQMPPGSKEEQWEEFERLNGDFHFFRTAHLYSGNATFFILYKDKEIIAVLKTQKSSLATDSHPFQGINYVSVKDKFQGQGLARQLYEAMFSYFSKGFVVGTDYENDDSQLKLEKMSYRLAKQFQVYFLTRKAIFAIEGELPKDLNSLYQRSEYRD